MPAYRFDIQDDDEFLGAEESFELADDREAYSLAVKAAGDMMAEAMPNGDSKRIAVSVRRDDGPHLLTVKLKLDSEWHGPRP
jgi:hypothetical protein